MGDEYLLARELQYRRFLLAHPGSLHRKWASIRSKPAIGAWAGARE